MQANVLFLGEPLRRTTVMHIYLFKSEMNTTRRCLFDAQIFMIFTWEQNVEHTPSFKSLTESIFRWKSIETVMITVWCHSLLARFSTPCYSYTLHSACLKQPLRIRDFLPSPTGSNALGNTHVMITCDKNRPYAPPWPQANHLRTIRLASGLEETKIIIQNITQDV